MNRIYLKWLILVLLNAAMGVFLANMLGSAHDRSIYWHIGMWLGIAAWWLIYSNIEVYLRIKQQDELVNRLSVAAVIKMLMQLLFIPDVYIGSVVINSLKTIGLMKYDLIAAYLATMGVGVVYGVIVYVFIGILRMPRFRHYSEP